MPKKKKAGRPAKPSVMKGKELRKAREEAGWSIRELAAKLKIAGSSVHALESGQNSISAERARVIVRAFTKAGMRPPPELAPPKPA